MSSKVAAALVLCLVLAGAVRMTRAQTLLEQYKQCFKDCQDRCQTEATTLCEMKCNGDCMAKDTAAKLEKVRQDMAAARQSSLNSAQRQMGAPSTQP